MTWNNFERKIIANAEWVNRAVLENTLVNVYRVNVIVLFKVLHEYKILGSSTHRLTKVCIDVDALLRIFHDSSTFHSQSLYIRSPLTARGCCA